MRWFLWWHLSPGSTQWPMPLTGVAMVSWPWLSQEAGFSQTGSSFGQKQRSLCGVWLVSWTELTFFFSFLLFGRREKSSIDSHWNFTWTHPRRGQWGLVCVRLGSSEKACDWPLGRSTQLVCWQALRSSRRIQCWVLFVEVFWNKSLIIIWVLKG